MSIMQRYLFPATATHVNKFTGYCQWKLIIFFYFSGAQRPQSMVIIDKAVSFINLKWQRVVFKFQTKFVRSDTNRIFASICYLKNDFCNNCLKVSLKIILSFWHVHWPSWLHVAHCKPPFFLWVDFFLGFAIFRFTSNFMTTLLTIQQG